MFDTAQQVVDVVLIVIVVFIFIRSLVGREKAVFSAALINKLLPSCHTCHTALLVTRAGRSRRTRYCTIGTFYTIMAYLSLVVLTTQ